MLVYGSVVDNVPISVMASLKSGPNLVDDLRRGPTTSLNSTTPTSGRLSLLSRLFGPWPKRKRLPRCPAPVDVIQRCVFGNIGYHFELEEDDLRLCPPPWKVRV